MKYLRMIHTDSTNPVSLSETKEQQLITEHRAYDQELMLSGRNAAAPQPRRVIETGADEKHDAPNPAAGGNDRARLSRKEEAGTALELALSPPLRGPNAASSRSGFASSMRRRESLR